MGWRKSTRGASATLGGLSKRQRRVRLELRSIRIVTAASRDTLTLDLLGLESPYAPDSQATSLGIEAGRSTKVTVRLAPHIARKMTAQARSAGLSHGVYLSTLIAGAPAVLTGADHRRAVAALTASNDEIARLATDINGLVRQLRRGEVLSVGKMETNLEALSSEVRAHLRHASRLIADLAPLASMGRADSAQKANAGGSVQ